MNWLRSIWYRQQRGVDLAILWPSCKSAAAERGVSLDVAKAAFATHVYQDTAWLVLGEAEIRRRIDALE
jgi:hypothetical protein